MVSNALGDMWLDLILELREMDPDDLLSPAEIRAMMAKIEESNA